MNLSQTLDTASAANAGATLELRAPNGAVLTKPDGTPVTITVLGKDSDVWIKNENAISNRRLAAGTRLKLTAEALKSDAISTLAKATIAWDGIGIDEDSTPCSYEAAVKLYTRFPDVREQVDTFIADRANFTKASPAN